MDSAGDPYRPDPTAEPELLPSALGFVDLLGYSERIKKATLPGEANKELLIIKNALDRAKYWVREDSGFGRRLHRTRFFSDCFVIGIPITREISEGEPELGDLFFSLALVQYEMAANGIFLRGAISVGPVFIDDDLIFGEALLEATEAERSITRDPRIILTPSAANRTKDHLRWYGDPATSPQNHALLLDTDGQIFIDYLSQSILIAEEEGGPFFDELLVHRDRVVEKLERYRTNPTVWAKYAWVASYHNWFCSQYNHYFDPSYKVSQEVLRLGPARLQP